MNPVKRRLIPLRLIRLRWRLPGSFKNNSANSRASRIGNAVLNASSPWQKSGVAPRPARHPADKARGGRISGIFYRRATQSVAMHRRSNAGGLLPRVATASRLGVRAPPAPGCIGPAPASLRKPGRRFADRRQGGWRQTRRVHPPHGSRPCSSRAGCWSGDRIQPWPYIPGP